MPKRYLLRIWNIIYNKYVSGKYWDVVGIFLSQTKLFVRHCFPNANGTAGRCCSVKEKLYFTVSW